MKRNILPEPVYIGMVGNKRRLTKRQQQLLRINGRPLPQPLTKEQKLKIVKDQINDTIKLIHHHEKVVQTCGEQLADLIQKQKTLETTR